MNKNNLLNKQPPELIERIGVDRSVVYNFTLISIDSDYIKKFSNVRMTIDPNSPVELKDGTRIGKLVIKDKYLGKLVVQFEKSNFKSTYYINTSLELMVSGDNNNLQNLTTGEYQNRIIDVFDYLKEVYSIEVDYSSLRVKKLELNATFILDEEYEKYRQPILLMIRNVPPKRYGNNKNNDAVKYATWYEADQKMKTNKLETALVKNSSVQLKIYNKSKHLKDIGVLDKDFPKDIMRVEYTITDKRILKNAFGDDLVSSLSDSKINTLFKKYFNRDIVARYADWHKNNTVELVELVKHHREINPQRWTYNFIRDIRQYSETHGMPILFDIYDLQKVFRILEPSKGRNAAKKFKKFLNNAEYEGDLIGNTKRLQEIMSKVLEM